VTESHEQFQDMFFFFSCQAEMTRNRNEIAATRLFLKCKEWKEAYR